MTTPGPEGDGVALCLSGGGYRAMVFHLGVLWRLNDARLLGRLSTVSSVSGGSVTAAALAARWGDLALDGTGYAPGFVEHVVEPVRRLARQGIDVASVLGGALSPWDTASERVVDAYREHLFGDATLQDLPDEPRFVINATNLESGALLRFTKRYLADYRVGRVHSPRVPLAAAVAASSAFPPFLSPCRAGPAGRGLGRRRGQRPGAPPSTAAGSRSATGASTTTSAWRPLEAAPDGPRQRRRWAGSPRTPRPPSDWGRHLVRVLGVIDNQVRSLRKRQMIEAYREASGRGPTSASAATSPTTRSATHSSATTRGRRSWPASRRASTPWTTTGRSYWSTGATPSATRDSVATWRSPDLDRRPCRIPITRCRRDGQAGAVIGPRVDATTVPFGIAGSLFDGAISGQGLGPMRGS